MYKVSWTQDGQEGEREELSLDDAMAFAKTLGQFVKISGPSFEVVGSFGVDSVKNGTCPDGVAYDWSKQDRAGRAPRKRAQ